MARRTGAEYVEAWSQDILEELKRGIDAPLDWVLSRDSSLQEALSTHGALRPRANQGEGGGNSPPWVVQSQEVSMLSNPGAGAGNLSEAMSRLAYMGGGIGGMGMGGMGVGGMGVGGMHDYQYSVGMSGGGPVGGGMSPGASQHKLRFDLEETERHLKETTHRLGHAQRALREAESNEEEATERLRTTQGKLKRLEAELVTVEGRAVEAEAGQRILQARMQKILSRSKPEGHPDSSQSKGQHAAISRLEKMLEDMGVQLEEAREREEDAEAKASEAVEARRWAERRVEGLQLAGGASKKEGFVSEKEFKRQVKLMHLQLEGERHAWDSERLRLEAEVTRCKVALGLAPPIQGLKIQRRPPPPRIAMNVKRLEEMRGIEARLVTAEREREERERFNQERERVNKMVKEGRISSKSGGQRAKAEVKAAKAAVITTPNTTGNSDTHPVSNKELSTEPIPSSPVSARSRTPSVVSSPPQEIKPSLASLGKTVSQVNAEAVVAAGAKNAAEAAAKLRTEKAEGFEAQNEILTASNQDPLVTNLCPDVSVAAPGEAPAVASTTGGVDIAQMVGRRKAHAADEDSASDW